MVLQSPLETNFFRSMKLLSSSAALWPLSIMGYSSNIEVSRRSQWELFRTQEIDTTGSVSFSVDFDYFYLYDLNTNENTISAFLQHSSWVYNGPLSLCFYLQAAIELYFPWTLALERQGGDTIPTYAMLVFCLVVQPRSSWTGMTTSLTTSIQQCQCCQLVKRR